MTDHLIAAQQEAMKEIHDIFSDPHRAAGEEPEDKVTSQPFYRRRKAEWVATAKDYTEWQHYSAHKSIGGQYWALNRKQGIDRIGHFDSLELAQAACESHFWQELEASVLERVNP